MKLQKYLLLAMVIIVSGSFTFPTGAFACEGTGDRDFECCFKCCYDGADCWNYKDGLSNDCVPNLYCVMNPFYCLDSCNRLGMSCFASAALNDDEIKIDILRKFRDEVLSKTPIGHEYIRLYYEWSPVIVRAMEEDEEFKQEVRGLIEQLLPMIEAIMK